MSRQYHGNTKTKFPYWLELLSSDSSSVLDTVHIISIYADGLKYLTPSLVMCEFKR